jgi:hypothetical protein
MKKISTPAVLEEAEYVCDVTGKRAVASLVMSFGYGSARDLDLLKVDLCSEVAEDILTLLQSRYPQFQPVATDGRPNCPLCHHTFH